MRKKWREGREEKKTDRIEWMEKRKGEEVEKENSLMKQNSFEMEKYNYKISGENSGMTEEMSRVKEDNSRLKELFPVITSLDNTKVTFPRNDGIQREGNRIINTSGSNRTCFIGEVMTSV